MMGVYFGRPATGTFLGQNDEILSGFEIFRVIFSDNFSDKISGRKVGNYFQGQNGGNFERFEKSKLHGVK